MNLVALFYCSYLQNFSTYHTVQIQVPIAESGRSFHVMDIKICAYIRKQCMLLNKINIICTRKYVRKRKNS